MAAPSDVLITSEVSRLPAEYAALLDASLHLPEEVAFFEKRVEIAQMLWAICIAAVAVPVGIVSIVIGVVDIRASSHTSYSSVSFWPFGFAITCVVVCWMVTASVRTRIDLMRRQKAGQPTRIGIFLTIDSVFEVSEFAYTIIPRNQFRGMDAGKLKYFHNNVEKSFTLPAALIESDLATLQSEIARWASATSA
jgi:hypothetical protein